MASFKAEFFISRAGADAGAAKFIAEIIREAGATVYYEDNFGHADFMRSMEEGYKSARIIALLSPEYQQSEYCKAEYNNVLGPDPNNLRQRLIVLRVRPCVPVGALQNLVYTDLVPVMTNRAVLASAVRKALNLPEPEIVPPLERAGQQIRHPQIRPFKSFAERDVLLDDLDRMLWQGRGVVAVRNSNDAAVALRGLGGVGKTVLAKEYAWRNRDKYHGIWWIRAEEQQTLVDDLVELGKRFIPGLEGMEPAKAAEVTIDQLAQIETEKPWLLIYDNVNDPTSIRLMTPATNAHVLITTRRINWEGEAEELPVDVFDRETAINFLVQEGDDREAAGRLADALDRLPLALSHARAYCRARSLSFDRYVANLPKLIDKVPRNTQYPASAFATFSLGIDQAKEDCTEAETLMELLSFWAPDQIPLGLIPADLLPEEALGNAIAALGALSLVRQETLPNGEPALSVHRMVQMVMRARLEAAARLVETAGNAARSTNAAYDDSGSFVAAQRNNYWLSHALAIVDHVAITPDTAWDLDWIWVEIGDLRIARGESAAALACYRTALEIATRFAQADPDDAGWQRDLSVTYNRIGDVLVVQGNLQESLKSFRDSLAIRARLVKAAPPGESGWQRDLSVSYEKVGSVLVAQGNLQDALASFRDSLAIRERLASADPDNARSQRDLLVAYNKVGDVLVDQGNLQEGLKSFCDSLAIADHLTQTDPGIAQWQHDLSISHERIGNIFVNQGNLGEALTSFRNSLAIRDRLARADPTNAVWQRELSVSHNKVGSVLLEQSSLQEALQSFRDGLDIADRLARADPGNAQWQRDLAASCERMGDIHERQSQIDQAMAAFERSLASCRVLIARNPDDIQSRLSTVVPLFRIGRLRGKDGRAHLQEALEILKPLADADRLDARTRSWIPEVEAQLAILNE